MILLKKSFEYETHLTLDQCQSLIEDKYPPKSLMSSTNMMIDSIEVDANQVSVGSYTRTIPQDGIPDYTKQFGLDD